jgi:glycerol-3-phosphate acyltransferase PlsY
VIAAVGIVAAAAYVSKSQNNSVQTLTGAWQVRTRMQTQHQRAESVAFLSDGRRLAVACPRYDRVVLYEVDEGHELKLALDLKTRGKPVALRTLGNQLFVLQRPSGDARHLEPAFWQRYSEAGIPIGDPWPLGFDPDDFVLLASGTRAVVLLSGNCEGETNRPGPSILVVDITEPEQPRIVTTLPLDLENDDPRRLLVSQNGSHLAVLTHAGTLMGIDISDIDAPSITGEISLADRKRISVSRCEGDAMLVPDRWGTSVIAVCSEGHPGSRSCGDDGNSPCIETLVALRPDASEVLFTNAANGQSLGVLELKGPGRIGSVRGMSIAYDSNRNLLAVTDRSGGVHLVTFQAASPLSP